MRYNIQYYFVCRTLYDSLYHYVDHIEDIEIDDLQDRLSEYETTVDQIAKWLLNNKNNGGVQVFEFYEKTLVYGHFGCYENNIRQFYEYIDQVSVSVNLKDNIAFYYLYYLESAWLKHVLSFFDKLTNELQLEDVLHQQYVEAKPHFQETIAWLEEQLIDVSQNYLPQEKLDILNEKMEATNEKLTKDWLLIIEEATNKFLPAT